MRFCLFSKIEFEITYPVALIEGFCFQTNFYASYDLLLPNRRIEDVGKIGARIDTRLLPKCKQIISKSDINLFKYSLDEFLKLDDTAIKNHVTEASSIINDLMSLGVGLSQTTKVLHTVYPEIFPMIDSMLQGEYLGLNPGWKQSNPGQILFDYYMNLRTEPTMQNLASTFNSVMNNLPCLTKVRVFDIIWWSYLKAKKLRDQNINIKWRTIK